MAEPQAPMTVKPTTTGKRVGISSALSTAAAVVVAGVVSTNYPFQTVSEKFAYGMNAPIEVRLAASNEKTRIDRLNATMVFAIGGSLLGVSLAPVGHARCSLLIRTAIGLIWGAVWGAGTGYFGMLCFAAVLPQATIPSLTDTGIGQAIVFALLGAGLGLMFGSFGRSPRQSVTAAIIGAIAGTVGALAVVIVVAITPTQSTADLIPAGRWLQVLWLILPFSAIGASIPLATDGRFRINAG